MSNAAKPPTPARHTLIALGIAAHRALLAWDSTVLLAASDGRLQEAMEALRHAANNYSLTTEFALRVTSKTGHCWLFTHDGTHCITDDVRKCERFATAERAERVAAHLRALYANRCIEVRAVAKLEDAL